ncbi:MAG: hypothetical protein MI742_12700 [Desulfobacterales bacterium]|nr:hypothetical protein [Desulfobacterales bacterium]
MVDYFTAYLPAMVRNTSLTTPSKHRAYLNSLLFSHRFVQSSNENGFSDPRGYIQKTEDLCKQRHQRLTRQGVVITHIYDQRLDARIYTLSTTVKGWCLGIAAYWIKHKRNGDNPFPKTIYTSSELSKETGVPIQLMKNQDKLTKFFQGQTNVAPKGVAWNVKNALDYIAGGRYSNAGPVIDFKLHRGGRKLKDMCRQFFGLLAPKSAPGHVRARDRFIVVLNLESGGHLAALDMVDVEYFDPNFGVMTTLKKNRKALVEFIFGSLSQVCYQGNSINSIQMYRIE